VTAGVVVMLLVLGLTLGRGAAGVNRVGVELVSWYWHFVDAVWVAVFTVVYLIGR
jgi:cytochrome c oxidase subunit 3/cytochrome o ubiquinol oxidase subunit 3